MQYEQFQKLAKSYTAVPVYRRLMADILTPVSLFLKIRQEAEYPFLLESVEGGEQLARYSFLGRNPYQILHYDGTDVRLEKKGGGTKLLSSPYFTALRELTTA